MYACAIVRARFWEDKGIGGVVSIINRISALTLGLYK
jgi:hypothetical protein